MLFRPKTKLIEGFQVRKVNFNKVMELKDKLISELRKEKYWNVLEAYPEIEYVEGHAEFIGNGKATINSKEINFNKALIATGSKPFIPPIKGLSKVSYLTSDSIFNLKHFPEHLVIIGGGAIGLELGQAFLRFGSRVSIFEALPEITMGEEPELRRRLKGLLEKDGMEIYTSAKVEEVSEYKGGILLKILHDNKTMEVIGSHILIAVGRRANTERIGIERVGVELDDRGFIKVDEHLQTTNKDIYGATTAAMEGAIAVENALLGNRKRIDYSSVLHAIFTNPELASVGFTEEAFRLY